MRQMLTLLKSIEFLINHTRKYSTTSSSSFSKSKNLSLSIVHQLDVNQCQSQNQKDLPNLIDESMENSHKKGVKGANRRNRNWRKRDRRNKNTTTIDTSEIPAEDQQIFRPTHFAAIQVDDPVIVEKIRQVQKEMLETEIDGLESKCFKRSMINVRKLHFTLEVFQIRKDNEDGDIAKAKLALENLWDKMQELTTDPPNMNMNISGISHFNDQVLFAQLQNPESIEKIAQVMRLELIQAGLKTQEWRPFKPHLTIAKLIKDPNLYRKKKIRKFPQDLWIKMKDETFGIQKFKGVQLLSMVDPQHPETGYYHELDSKNL